MNEIEQILRRLRQYAYARDRRSDHETRTITITDNEAIVIIEALETLQEVTVEIHS